MANLSISKHTQKYILNAPLCSAEKKQINYRTQTAHSSNFLNDLHKDIIPASKSLNPEQSFKIKSITLNSRSDVIKANEILHKEILCKNDPSRTKTLSFTELLNELECYAIDNEIRLQLSNKVILDEISSYDMTGKDRAIIERIISTTEAKNSPELDKKNVLGKSLNLRELSEQSLKETRQCIFQNKLKYIIFSLKDTLSRNEHIEFMARSNEHIEAIEYESDILFERLKLKIKTFSEQCDKTAMTTGKINTTPQRNNNITREIHSMRKFQPEISRTNEKSPKSILKTHSNSTEINSSSSSTSTMDSISNKTVKFYPREKKTDYIKYINNMNKTNLITYSAENNSILRQRRESFSELLSKIEMLPEHIKSKTIIIKQDFPQLIALVFPANLHTNEGSNRFNIATENELSKINDDIRKIYGNSYLYNSYITYFYHDNKGGNKIAFNTTRHSNNASLIASEIENELEELSLTLGTQNTPDIN